MIIYIDPVSPKWVRHAAFILASAGLMALLLAPLDAPTPQAPHVVGPRAGYAEVLGEKREITRLTTSEVFAEAPTPSEAPRRMWQVPPNVGPRSAAQSPQSFRFLGKVTAEGETSIVLYGHGRTLTVRATGPLDDDYTVDALEEGYIVLRQVHHGVSQLLKLTSQQETLIRAGSAAETPED